VAAPAVEPDVRAPRPVTALTRRGWTLAGAAAGLVVGSRILGAGPLAGLGIAGALLIAFAAVWVTFRRPGLSLGRTVRPARLHAGGEGRVLLSGVTTTATPLLTLTDQVDGGRRAARFVVAPQSAGSELHAAYRIPTARRGRHVIGPLLATVSDPLGLARRSRVAAEEIDVVVCPRIHDIVSPRRGGGGEPATNAEGARAPALEPLGEFLALREYEPGDDPRQVHWRSSARLGELMVRQDEAASPGRVILVLDTRAAVHDDASFEVAIEAVASLAVRLHRDHAPVEVITTGGEVLGRPGPGAVELLLDRLAVVETSSDDHLGAVFASMRNRLGVGSIVAATGTLDPSLVHALTLLRSRSLVTAITTRAQGGPRPPALAVVDASSVGFADAWNATRRRTRSQTSRWKPATSPSPLHSPR
jgi:uncharacterized protein (DUF58 family)